MSAWIPIPVSALATVRGARPRGALLDLYYRAHQLEYASFTFTDRELANDWEVTRHDVWRILEALVEADCIVLDRAPPGQKKPSRLTVKPAFPNASGQTRSQNFGQKESDTTKTKDKSRPDARPDARPSRANQYARARVDQIRSDHDDADDAEGGGTLPDLELDLAELLDLQAKDEPRFEVDARDESALRAWLSRGVSLRQLRSVWAWSAVSEDPIIAGAKVGWRRWRSMLVGKLAQARIDRATAWDLAGRPIVAVSKPKPSKRYSAANLLAELDQPEAMVTYGK